MRLFKYPILAAVLLAASCTVREESELVNMDALAPVFTAEIESLEDSESKVYTDETLKVLWHADDRISIFNKNTYNSQYRFNGATGTNSGSFTKVPDDSFVTANELSYVLAVYPYSEATSVTNSGLLTMPLPATQAYGEGSFGRGANAMVAATDKNLLIFKNICGYLMFKLYGSGLSVSSLTLTANGGEALAGTALVTMAPGEMPAVEIASEGALSSVTVNCETPVALGPSESDYSEFWFVLPPVTMAQGFTLTVTLNDGRTFQKTHSGSITITRSRRSRMAPLKVIPTNNQVPPDDEIWYTTVSGNVLNPYKKDEFGANIISNTYENGKGVIKFDGKVTKIGSHAFWRLQDLKTLQMPNSVTEIGEYAFEICSNLEDINLSDNLKTIKMFAITDAKIKTVTIPDSVTTIENYSPFENCKFLEAFYGKFASADNRLLIVNGEVKSFAPAGLTSYTIPEGVTRLCEYSFALCDQLQSLVLPETLKTISFYAMLSCTGLTSLRIPDSVTTVTSGLASCKSLKTLSGTYVTDDGRAFIRNGVMMIFAPSGLSAYTVPDGVETIGGSLFAHTELQSITLPNSVKVIERDAFFYCKKMRSISLPANLETISGYAFQYSGLETITIPSSVKNIYYDAFASCTSLTKATVLPNTPPSIRSGLFRDSGSFPIYVPAESVEAYKSAQYWSDYADRIQAIPEEGNGEAENVEVDIPDNNVYEAVSGDFSFNVTADGSWTIEVENIESSASVMTKGSSDFVSVSITSGGSGVVGVDVHLTSNFALVERGAHLLLRHKKKTHTITITQRPRIYETSGTTTIAVLSPGNLQAYINEAFTSPNNASRLRLVGTLNNNDVNTLYNLNNLKYLDLCLAAVPDEFSLQYSTTLEYIYLPDNMKVLPNKALYSCKALKYVYGLNVETIKDNALYGCLAMTECYFPAVEEICYGAFQMCESLESLVFPKVKKIQSGAFSGCDAVKTVSFDALEELESGVLSYNAPLNIEVLNLPKLKSVGDNSFRGQTKLKTLELPSLKTLGKNIISYSSIEELNFPVLEVIPQGAFSGENNLRRVYCEKVKTVCQSAFQGCERLKDVIMPHATTLDHNAFYGCTLGGELDFSSVVVIGDRCFEKSTGIGSSTPVFPLTTWIGARAFAECVNLVAIQIPLASHICTEAFRGCTKLTSVSENNVLPTVNLEDYAFSNCPCLRSLRFPALSILGSSCFDGSGLTTLAFGSLPWKKVNDYGFPVAPFEYWTFPINGEDAKKIHLIINDLDLPPTCDDDHPWWKKEVDNSISFLRCNWSGYSKYQD